MARSTTQNINVTAHEGAFQKQFPDKASYLAELSMLRGFQGRDFAPELLGFNDQTRTLRIAAAGKDLFQLVVHEERAFSISQIQRVMKGLLKGVAELHERGNVHYDISPRNICVDGDPGGEFKVKLIDFGLSYDLKSIPQSHRTQKLGTLEYSSPEHLAMNPEQGQKADVWGCAVAMVHLIQKGFGLFSTCLGSIEAQLKEAHLGVPEVTGWGERVPWDTVSLLKAMLRLDPNDRPTSKVCYHLLKDPNE